MKNKEQISTKIAALPIEELCLASGFQKNSRVQLTGENFILSFFSMLRKGKNSLSDWRKALSIESKRVFSRSVIQSKMKDTTVDFVKGILQKILPKQFSQARIRGLTSSVFRSFNRVFLEDSTCLKLPSNLAQDLPGSHSRKGAVATARIQFRTELKSGSAAHFAIQSYRDNDQKYAKRILDIIRPGDLIIRDLGYFVLWVFRLIHWMNAFFLTRFRYALVIREADSAKRIDLLDMLTKADRQNQTIIDKPILLGENERLPVRFVAIKLPQQIAQRRRRKHAQNRNKRANQSKEYMQFLGWIIFVTNVSKEVWTPKQILHVYGLRWRIEMIFKAWKSKLKLKLLFANKPKLSLQRVLISLILFFIWVLLAFIPYYHWMQNIIFEQKKNFLSLLKFADFFNEHFDLLNKPVIDQFSLEIINATCAYENRTDVLNFYQNLYMLNFIEH